MGEVNIPIVSDKNIADAHLDIYSKLVQDRIIFLTGEITTELASIIVAQLLFLDNINNNDISIYINSPGGNVQAGLAIYDTMNLIKSDVSTIAFGECASMASIILSGGKKGKRYCLEHTRIMIHQASGFVEGKTKDIKSYSKEMEEIENILVKILTKNTGRNIKNIKTDISKIDFWMSAEKAIKYNIIDQILLNL